jgi:hypothetical protein
MFYVPAVSGMLFQEVLELQVQYMIDSKNGGRLAYSNVCGLTVYLHMIKRRNSYNNTLPNCRRTLKKKTNNIPLPILLIILFLIYRLSKINTPIIITNDIGNGTNIEMAMLMQKDIPIHIIWLRRNCLLLLLALIFHLPI